MASPRPAARRLWLLALVLALLGHGVALVLLRLLMQPPTLLRDIAPPMYTRMLQAEAPPDPVEVAAAPATISKPNRPTAVIRSAQQAIKNKAKPQPRPRPPSRPARTASAPTTEHAAADASIDGATPDAALPEPEATAAQQTASAPDPQAPASSALAAASTSSLDASGRPYWML